MCMTFDKYENNIKNGIYNYGYSSCVAKKLPEGYVFDEEKSVRWNREKLEKYNKEEEERVRKLKEQNKAISDKKREDLKQAISNWMSMEKAAKLTDKKLDIIVEYMFENFEFYDNFVNDAIKLVDLIEAMM